MSLNAGQKRSPTSPAPWKPSNNPPTSKNEEVGEEESAAHSEEGELMDDSEDDEFMGIDDHRERLNVSAMPSLPSDSH